MKVNASVGMKESGAHLWLIDLRAENIGAFNLLPLLAEVVWS